MLRKHLQCVVWAVYSLLHEKVQVIVKYEGGGASATQNLNVYIKFSQSFRLFSLQTYPKIGHGLAIHKTQLELPELNVY